MDLLGDIVEKDVINEDDPTSFDIVEKTANDTGFPELYKPKKISSWKKRLNEKKKKKNLEDQSRTSIEKKSDAEAIHEENMKVISNMSPEDIAKERAELIDNLDPKLIANLLKNIKRRDTKRINGEEAGAPLFANIDGASGTWIGGTSSLHDLVPMSDNEVNKALGVEMKDNKKKVVTWTDDDNKKDVNTNDDEEEEVELDDDDIAPLEYQMAQSIDHMTNDELMQDVHFMKYVKHKHGDTEEDETPLDLNDPNFNEKLHTKFFPDLPNEVNKLKWMEDLPTERSPNSMVIDDVSKIRFDFKGNMVSPEADADAHSGLYHHSNNPEQAGYTIPELAHLSRSTFPQQRSISIKIIGRILYKLGKQTYYQLVPEVDTETFQELGGTTQKVTDHYYKMIWDLVKDCKVIESLNDNIHNTNMSVKSYAIDALWLWKKGQGASAAQ